MFEEFQGVTQTPTPYHTTPTTGGRRFCADSCCFLRGKRVWSGQRAWKPKWNSWLLLVIWWDMSLNPISEQAFLKYFRKVGGFYKFSSWNFSGKKTAGRPELTWGPACQAKDDWPNQQSYWPNHQSYWPNHQRCKIYYSPYHWNGKQSHIRFMGLVYLSTIIYIL